LKIDMTSFFSAEAGPIWIKFRKLVQNGMSTAVIWPKLKPEVELQYGGPLGEFSSISSQSHLPHCRVLTRGEFNAMIPELRVTLQCAANGRIHCHDSRATCHITGCCHMANSMTSFQSHVSRCRIGLLPLGEFTVTIAEPHATLQGAVNWRNQYHIAGCKNSIRHIENRFSPYFIYFCFLNAVWASTSGGFRIVSDTLVRCAKQKLSVSKNVRVFACTLFNLSPVHMSNSTLSPVCTGL